MALHWRLAAIAAFAVAVSGCTELTAEHPLFSITDQAESAPIAEGVWIAISEDCPERHMRTRGRFPAACDPFELRRTADGAWRFAFRPDLVHGSSAEARAEAEQRGPTAFILAPAVERTLDARSFAPLYVAELRGLNPEGEDVGYAVLAPVGPMPAAELRLLSLISCDDILRDGPIEGVTPHYTVRTNEQPASEIQQSALADSDTIETVEVLSGCTASSQAAVREAARRAAIENIGELANTRLIRVRP